MIFDLVPERAKGKSNKKKKMHSSRGVGFRMKKNREEKENE